MKNLIFKKLIFMLVFAFADSAEAKKTIALWGATNFVNLKNHGYLEALLLSNSDNSLFLRNISWQADTVYRQQRPRNFGSHADFLKRVQADQLILSFGQSEVIEKQNTTESFYQAYDQFISEIKTKSTECVFVGLYEFPKVENHLLPDLSKYNLRVKQFNEQIKKLAAKHGFKFIDLAKLKINIIEDSVDGLLLNKHGLKKLSHAIVAQITNIEIDTISETLRQKIIFKNELWDRHWRPDNWGFVYGNRTQVASSRDHINREVRWLPQEVEGIYKEVKALEQQIKKNSK